MKKSANQTARKSGALYSALLLAVLVALPHCQSYETHAIRTKKWPNTQTEQLRDVGIGYFETVGSGKSPLTRQNFYDNFAFALREIGYITAEQTQVAEVLTKTALPRNRLLADDEVSRLTREFGARLYLQGRIQEVKTEQLLEDSLQVAISVWIYAARRGEKLGEIQLFGKDLEFHTARQTLEMSRILAAKLEELIVDRGPDDTYSAAN